MHKLYHSALKCILLIFALAFAQLARAQNPSVVYGTPDFNPEPKYSGITYTSSNPAVATIIAGKIHIVGVGTTTIGGMLGSISGSKAINVTPANLVITATNKVGISGSPLPALTVTYSGFVNGDTTTALTTQPVLITTATSSSPTNYYPITVSGAAAKNYNITYVAGTLTMVSTAYLKAPLTKTYGDPNFYVFGQSTNMVSYARSNDTVATVSNTGLVTITGTGTVIFTIGNSLGSISKMLTVNPMQPPSLSYPVNRTYTEGQAVNINPINTGGAVPAKAYAQESILAGSIQGTSGAANGNGMAATFNEPNGVAVDAAGNVYLADMLNSLIRKITPNGTVSTFGTALGPAGVAVDATGNVYVADNPGSVIRKITPSGVESIFAGNTERAGSTNGPGTLATFNQPNGVAVDAAGNVYVADYGNNLIRKITPSGVVSTIASNVIQPISVAVDKLGNVYFVTDYELIQKLSPAGVLTNIELSVPSTTTITNIQYLTVDTFGNIYATINYGGEILKVSPSGVAAILFTDPFPQNYALTGMATDNFGNLYVANSGFNQIDVVSLTGYLITPALPGGLTISNTGNIVGTPTAVYADAASFTVTGYNLGGNSAANFHIVIDNSITSSPDIYLVGGVENNYNATPTNGAKATANGLGLIAGITYDKKGNIYISSLDNRIHKIDASTQIVSTFAGIGVYGQTPGFSGDGGPALQAQLGPGSLAIDSTGNIYLSDYSNNLIRRIDAITNIITTIAGNGIAAYTGDNGPATSASLNYPAYIAIDATNNIYFEDLNNLVIRKIDGATHNISTFAGNHLYGITGDGNLATLAAINFVTALTLDKNGNLYLAESDFGTIRKVDTASHIISTVVGTPNLNGNAYNQKYAGDGSLASAAIMGNIAGLTFDAQNNFYLSDQTNSVVRKVDGKTGLISTYAGIGASKYSGDNGPAISAGLDYPGNLFIDTAGNLNMQDGDVIRKIGGALNNLTTNSLLTDDLLTQPKVNTALSPNGDGINDVLTIKNIQNYPQNTVTLINQAGAKVYQASGYDNVNTVFNGRSNLNGALQQPGTYFYMLQYNDKGVAKTQTGYFVIKY